MDYVSDLHLDNAMLGGPHGNLHNFQFEKYKNPESDILVVAGDTAEYTDDAIDFLNAARDHYRLVIGVNGNHEKGPVTKDLVHGAYILDDGVRVVDGDTAFVGGCLAPDQINDLVNGVLLDVYQDKSIKHLVIVSHYVPFADLSVFGLDSKEKCNGLLNRLPGHCIKTTIIFGHLHNEVDITIGNYRFVSNPRGYRARRRDGSAFRGFKTL